MKNKKETIRQVYDLCKQPLPETASLCVYDTGRLIFSSKGKWLMPLFDCERFLSGYSASGMQLSAHDTAAGKAAVVLMVRMGIKRIHADLVSNCARTYIDSLNKTGSVNLIFTWNKIVPRLFCETEDQLESMSDIDAMYAALRSRAHLDKEVSTRGETAFGQLQ
jgi:hypothetical protein